MANKRRRRPIVCGVYEIRNLTTQKRYVGSSKNIFRRWQDHKSRLVRGFHHSKYLQRAWYKHGAADFVLSILELVDSETHLIGREQYWMDTLQSFERDKGYNADPIAGSEQGITAKAIGSNHGLTTLTEAQVAIIKQRLALGDTLNMIAKDYGVCFQTISNIKRGLVWLHVPNPILSDAQRQEATSRHKRLRSLLSPKTKLAEEDVIEIRQRAAAGETGVSIAKDYPVGFGAICAAISGKTWKSTPGPIIPDRKRGEGSSYAKLTAKAVCEIRCRLKNGESAGSIAKDYPVTKSAIGRIKLGQTWRRLIC